MKALSTAVAFVLSVLSVPMLGGHSGAACRVPDERFVETIAAVDHGARGEHRGGCEIGRELADRDLHRDLPSRATPM